MGSVQEPISVSSEMASESRDVEMQDGDEADEVATSVPSKANGASPADLPVEKHVTNDHLISDERKKANHSAANGDDAQDSAVPIPSVEKDDEGSPSTAAEQEETTAPAANHNNQVSPAQQRQSSTQATKQASVGSNRFDEDAARLRELLEEISPQAAQKVLREKWRMFLFDQYDETHISFILRAGMKNASHGVAEKVTRDEGIFKDTFLEIASAKPPVIERVIANVTVPQLNHMPQRVLDKAIAERIHSVSAKQLIKWLAEADRLGYKLDDIIDEDDESVVPNLSRAESHDADMMDEVFEVEPRYQPPYHQAPPQLASANRDPLLEQQEMHRANMLEAQRLSAMGVQGGRQPGRPGHQHQKYSNHPPPSQIDGQVGELRCPHCTAVMPTMLGYTYHISKQFCVKKQQDVRNSPYLCTNCLQRFTQHGGLNYHNMNFVCKGGKKPTGQQEEATGAPQANIPALPPPRPAFTGHSPPIPPTYSPPPYQPQDRAGRPPIPTQRPSFHSPAVAHSTPMATPPSKKLLKDGVRLSPSELPPARLAAMEQDLADAENDYQAKVAAIDPNISAAERALRMVSLKNGIQSRKSTIRKAHGVSLRMRDKDKQARKAAGITPVPSSLQNMSTPISASAFASSPLSGPPVSSFSPVNAPAPRSGPSDYGRPGNPPHPSAASTYNGPSSGNPPASRNASQYSGSPLGSNASPIYPSSQHAHPPNPSRYTGPPVPSSSGSYSSIPPGARPTVRNHTPYQDHNPHTLTHVVSATAPAGPTGFGVLKLDGQRGPNTTFPNNKRRRSSADNEAGRQARAAAGNQMQQIRAEDASAKMARRTPLAEGQAQSDRDTPMSDAPPAARPEVERNNSNTNTKNTAITIIDSSDDENERPAPRLSPAQAQSPVQARSPGQAYSPVQARSPNQARSPPQARSPHQVRSPVLPQSASRAKSSNHKEKAQPENGADITDSDSDSDGDIPAQRQTRSTTDSLANKRGFIARRGGHA